MGTVIGLDLSLTSTGCCALPTTWRGPVEVAQLWQGLRWHRIAVKGNSRSMVARVERCDAIAQEVVAFVRAQPRPRHVFLEAYAYGRGTAAYSLAELGGVVRLALHRLSAVHIEAVTLDGEVSPSSWRRLLLGRHPQRGAKAVAHAQLRAAGAPCLSGDELDAFGVANAGLAELGGLALTLA